MKIIKNKKSSITKCIGKLDASGYSTSAIISYYEDKIVVESIKTDSLGIAPKFYTGIHTLDRTILNYDFFKNSDYDLIAIEE